MAESEREGSILRRDIIIDYLKSRKYLVLVILIIIVVGTGATVYIRSQKMVTSEELQIAKTENSRDASSDTVVTIASIEGTVEIGDKDGANWQSSTVGQSLSVGSAVRTQKGSRAVVAFAGSDYLILDEKGLVILTSISETAIEVELQYGQAYSQVEKKENQTYSVAKDSFKVTALGTEFMVTVPESGESIEVMVYKSKVRYQMGTDQNELDELNKLVLNTNEYKYAFSMLTDEEKGQNSSYIALLEKTKASLVATVANEQPAQTQTTASTASKSSGQSTNSQASPTSAAATSDVASTSTSSSSDSSSSIASNSSQISSSSSTPSPTPVTSTTIEDDQSETIFGRFSDTSVESIVNSLQLVYDDALDDFTTPPGGAPSTGVYEYDPVDLDNLYMGIHNGRLYINVTTAGTFPTAQETINGDKIKSVAFNVGVYPDGESWTDCGEGLRLHFNIEYHDDGQIWYNATFHDNCLSTLGYEHSETWGASGNGQFHTYNAGLGKQSLVVSYALSDLAIQITAGTDYDVTIASEAESSLWHHYSYDENVLSGESVFSDWMAAEI